MHKLLIALIASAGLVSAAHAAPQNTSAPAQKPQTSAAAQVDVSDEQVKEFVKVHQEVSDVSAKYQAELQATSDPEAASQISQQANKEMVQIVEKSPLSVEEYNQYAMLLQKDQKFQKKYLELAD